MAAASESVMADAMALEDVASSPSITVHEQKLYADLASTQIVNLSPDQRLERLVSMKPGQLRGFMKGLTPEERSQLTAGMTPQQKETVVALIKPHPAGGRRTVANPAAHRCLQPTAAAGGDDGFLAEPLQRLSEEGAACALVPGGLRTKRDCAACHG